MNRALVNKIIPFSCVDGPGNRTAIFFQECNFNCLYCHNPETINRCVNCGACVPGCPVHALELIDGAIRWDSARCCKCDQCIKVCPNSSSPRTTWMTVEEVLAELRGSLPFIQGITVSGGECTLQEEFLVELFQAVHSLGKTCFCDTNALRDFRQMPALTEAMDSAMVDIKAWDPAEHQMLVGQPNEMVLSNTAYLASIGKLYEIRTVVIPGLLNNRLTVEESSKLIAPYADQVRYKLIKYRPLGVRTVLIDASTPDDALMEELRDLALANGVKDVVII